MKKIAVIGCGLMGSRHIQALRALGYDASAVMGRDSEKTKKFALDNGIGEWATEFSKLEQMGIGTAHVCTPPASHFDIVKEALEAGMNVVCEKPLGLDAQQCRMLSDLAREKKAVNAVGFNTRFHAAVQKAREMILGGDIGDVLLVNGSYMQEFHALPAQLSWRYKEKCLALTEIGSHWIDAMRFVTGCEVDEASATFGRFFPDRTVKDGIQYPLGTVEGKPFHADSENAVIASMKLNGGGLASMVLSEITCGKSNRMELCITGTKGALWWNTDELGTLHSATKGRTQEIRFDGDFDSSFVNMFREIYADIESGGPEERHMYASFDDGLRNCEVCEAMQESEKNQSKWESVK